MIELYELYRNGNVQLLQDQVNLFNQVARQRQEPGIVQSMNAMQISPELAETSNTSTNHNQLDQNINTTTQEWNDNDESNDGWQVVRSRKKKDR